jgi:DNA-binding GntR family transcriptional regulator
VSFSFTIGYASDKLCPNIIDEDLENNPISVIIENKYHIYIAKVKRYLEPVNYKYSKKVSKILKIKENEPFFYLQTYYYTQDNTPIAYYKGFYSSNKSRFT